MQRWLHYSEHSNKQHKLLETTACIALLGATTATAATAAAGTAEEDVAQTHPHSG